MGCGDSKTTPADQTAIQPVPIKNPATAVQSESTQDSNHSKSQNKNSTYTTSENDKKAIIVPQKTTTTNDAQRKDKDYVDIEISNPNAFNDSFVKQRQQAIDDRSSHSIIKSWHLNSLQELIDTIKSFSKEKSLIDRHWIIFYWITHNIEFDIESYFRKIDGDQSAEVVFQSRKGVSAGYANLYKYLCDKLELLCETVIGHSKNYAFDIQEDIPFEPNHVWNVIEIDHHWYLIEPTWATGFITDQKVFKSELISYYFCPRPNEMIYHHLPNNEKWQLLLKPIKMTQYLQLPKFYPTYFILNLELRNADVNFLPNKSYAEVLIRTPSDVYLTADLILNNQKIDNSHRVVFDKQKQLYCCYFAPINLGHYKIIIYAKQGDTELTNYNAALGLTLDVKDEPQKPISFPKIWKDFTDLDLEVIAPKDTHLIKLLNGTKQTEIQIRTPNDVVLHARLEDENGGEIIDGNQVYYDRHEKIWRCKFAPNCDGVFQAFIMAKKKSNVNHHTPVILFRIEAEQISKTPLSYPKTSQLFYDLDLKVIAPENQGKFVLLKNENEVEIHITAPDTVELLGRLINNNQETIQGGYQVFYDRHKKFWRCKFAHNENGLFDAQILAKKKSDDGDFNIAITFKIEAKQIPIPRLSYPYTWQLFHDFDLQIIKPEGLRSVTWPENASFAEIRIRAPDDIRLSCKLEYNDVEIENGTLVQYDHKKQVWQLLFAPQQTGLHKLDVYAERHSDTKNLSGAVAQFDLYVTSIHKPMTFPITYGAFQSNKCQIHEPLNGVLKKGTIVPIHCIIPGAIEVDLKIDSKMEQYK